ncbi:tRNA (cytosine(72)-C(5))-methyltransferase NSUN6 isoform X4 [Pongo abelii]|uniref:tRNA (cytosine(72)-C(5))-methyltransferase NSUN6 isoform X4 n=1 Tax=Pongo abelii TaxID=9601 RepID=UPI0023E89473|nr:tRNA (cytosine(72)-C(5))-methyltransferase NSUN6 isoform X4 [Pongo abelii]XP_054377992.1 tRNA (cytosine(72)-C(5))-methyltransferase NSUN6 isoform X4 [Pongo abelii]XP_054377993.1 tRNA (cytosine(72)-C(5))-methyltransferase NSUN6 isoform X4 [Pongo abelii]XP_054377994.1 tRNA (cytosine(72)-C(5))-methyltransferase NSUN6 isoform X4 [Pongo abelii]XP_054377995.1 tRNA (cytosine(72)-C(5))-methyltransferase NSUN6 isoform X4 [Pongo abelii]XP_054377996.1 tRNA (cytosine(72)-C(5))-methyltransferase NSUN6 i
MFHKHGKKNGKFSIVTALGKQEAERKFETLLKHLSHPPSFTTVRVNTHLASVQHVKNLLLDELQKQFNGLSVPILQHPDLQDVLLIPVIGPRVGGCVEDETEEVGRGRKNIKKQQCEAIVGAQCGNAVLRGAHVYAPGIVSASKFMKAGDVISVYSDIKGKCKKGAKEFDGTKVFLGNGISELSRKEIFSGLPELKYVIRGMGIRMTEPVYLSPSFDNVLPRYLFLQNLPSALVTHVLNPQPGEKILDLCAAPGGKTTHIAALMHDQGEVIALDKIFNKVEKIKQNALLLGLNSIRAFCFDGTKAVKLDMVEDTEGDPPFLPESFDRILLDAPCSGMGQRPNMACTWSLKEVASYQPLQRKLFTAAVQLLKPEGVLVYSTCTITLAENEEQVAWALTKFPCLQLQPQEPQIGGEGMRGAGLSCEQLKQLQRFDPSAVPLPDTDMDSLREARREDMLRLANKDSIGFFIAKFVKCKST